MMNFLVKYNASGTVLWAKSAGGTGYDYAYSLTTDTIGNVYMSGSFSGPAAAFDGIVLTNTNMSFADMFIAKYDSNGNILWIKSAAGNYGDVVYSISSDNNDNIFVTGFFDSPTLNWGSVTLTNSSGTADIFFAKYDSNGNLIWAKSIGGVGYEYGNSVSADTNGNIFIAGDFGSPYLVFGNDTLSNTGNVDFFISKIDSTGNILWAKSIGGTNDDFANCVAQDSDGNAYITGYFQSPNINFGSTNFSNSGGNQMYLAKYDSIGNILWAKNAVGSNEDLARCVVVDAIGNLYVDGSYTSTFLQFGNTTCINMNLSSDIFIAKISSSVGLSEISNPKSSITISPNPFTSSFTITLPTTNTPKSASVKVFNLLGEVVQQSEIRNPHSEISVDMSGANSGIYFTEVKTVEGIYWGKVVKQ